MKAVRSIRIAPATEEYLEEKTARDPLLKQVLTGLIWRLTHEQEPIGYKLPGFNPAKYIIKKSSRLPVPRLLRLTYQFTRKEIFIELAQVVDFKDYEDN